MKPFLAIDITNNKKNEEFNGEEFVVARPSSAMDNALENASDDAIDVINKSRLPLVFRIIEIVSAIAGTGITLGILRTWTDEEASFAEMYKNIPWLFWVAGALIIVAVILGILSHKKEKTVMESDEANNVFSDFDQVSDNIFRELKVPSDAKTVDVLSFNYKLKKDDVVISEDILTNFEFKIFADSENLYLASLEEKYGFPLSSFTKISTVNKRVSIFCWNKETEANKGEYKQYKLMVDKYDCVSFKPYYILEFSHNGEEWGIYIPKYELPIFEGLTGLKAE